MFRWRIARYTHQIDDLIKRDAEADVHNARCVVHWSNGTLVVCQKIPVEALLHPVFSRSLNSSLYGEVGEVHSGNTIYAKCFNCSNTNKSNIMGSSTMVCVCVRACVRACVCLYK